MPSPNSCGRNKNSFKTLDNKNVKEKIFLEFLFQKLLKLKRAQF